MKAKLRIVEGKQKDKTIELTEPIFLIGRGERCHLRPASELVSREHAEFKVEGDSLIVRDMGSRNGTLVNGKALTAAQSLQDGDRVQVGPLTFAVSIADLGKTPAKLAQAGAEKPARGKSKRAAEEAAATAPVPENIHGGSTIMIPAFKSGAGAAKSKASSKSKHAPAPTGPPSSTTGDEGSEIMRKMMGRRRHRKA